MLKNYQLPIKNSIYNFKNVKDWILQFHKIKIGHQLALSLIDKLENQQTSKND